MPPESLQTPIYFKLAYFSYFLRYCKDTIFEMNFLFVIFNSETFCENLHESLHHFFIKTGVIDCHNFNEVFAGFIKVIEKAIDLHAPFKKLSRKERKLRLKP